MLNRGRLQIETGDGTEIIASDDTQCTFNPNSYHMLYVASKEAFLYKHNSFTRAKAVSYNKISGIIDEFHKQKFQFSKKLLQCHPTVTKNRNSKFHTWLSTWASRNVADAQHRLCQDWLLGRYENLIPHRTRVITDNDQSRTPYRQYNRYRVEHLQSDSQQSEPNA